jgi:hypothetical protein
MDVFLSTKGKNSCLKNGSKMKISKNLELSRLPNTKKFIFNGRDFPCFNQISFVFTLERYGMKLSIILPSWIFQI